MQEGSRFYPEYPIRSHAEAYYHLRKTLGHHASSVYNCSIKPYAYRTNKFVIGTDTEKILEARAGDSLTVKVKYTKPAACGAISAQRTAKLMHIMLHYDHILEIHDTSARVFD